MVKSRIDRNPRYNNQPVMGAATVDKGGTVAGAVAGAVAAVVTAYGGSGSGDGDSNVAATTAMTAMCDKRG
jgi:hypothetical protein